MANQQITELALWALPLNGAGLLKIPTLDVPVYKKMAEFLPLQFWQTLNLSFTVDWNFLSRYVNEIFLQSVILEKNEIPILSLYGWDNGAGWLLLTTQRLIRLKNTAWSGKFQIDYDVPLEDIKGMTGDRGHEGPKFNEALSKFHISTTNREIAIELLFSPLETPKPLATLAIKGRKEELEKQRKKDKIHIMMDFSFLKSSMEKGGVVMQVLKCPECGATVDFPKAGNTTQCQHCGKNIYAQDIFEKVKDLL